MRVLVIGGTGFVGPRVVRRLCEMGHELVLFHRGRTAAELPEAARHVAGDRDRLREHADELRALRPDVVLHMVAGTVVRLPQVFGPGDPQHRLFPLLKRMDDGRPAILLGELEARQRWSLGDVENVGLAIALAVADERAAGRVYNVAYESAPTRAEWVRRVGDAAGWRGEVAALPADLLPPHLAPRNDYGHDLVVDTGRIRRELGYAETLPLDESLRRAIAWQRANPPADFDAARFDYAAEDAALARARAAGAIP